MLTVRQKIYLPLKRFLDIVCALSALIVFSPLYLLLAILVKATSKGPVLFKQDRIGKNKKVFKIRKFRTMRVDVDPNIPTHMLSNPDACITKVGRFMRKTSLDEIPQAINILCGHMSVIGPRPALWNQYDLISQRDLYHANDIRPGLSGWAQCNGRDTISIEKKAQLDGEYVKRFNFWFDLKILFLSVFRGFTGKGEKEGKNAQ